MVVATGYFAKAKAYAEDGYALVSIALKAPWFLDKSLRLYHCEQLFPTASILALKDSPSEYERRYRSEVLGRLRPIEVFDHLYEIAELEHTDRVVLMCYESPEKFCHRHIVADWISKRMPQMPTVSEIDVRR